MPLELCYRSLCDTGDDVIANGKLLDLIRRVRALGMGLCRLDIRQEASRHTRAMNAVTEMIGIGSYSEWSEEQRQEFLLQELSGRRPLIPWHMNFAQVIFNVFLHFICPSDLCCMLMSFMSFIEMRTIRKTEKSLILSVWQHEWALIYWARMSSPCLRDRRMCCL